MRGAVVLLALQWAAGKTCDRTYRLGAQHAAAPSSVSMMTSGFDIEGACVAFYDQPSGVIALERVEAGYLDMAFVGSVPYAAAAARGAQITAVANPITVLESSRLVASADIRLLDDLRHKRIWTVKTSNFHHNLLGTLQSVGININDVEIKFATPADIKRAWNWGTVDAAWCSGDCPIHLLRTPRGGEGAACAKDEECGLGGKCGSDRRCAGRPGHVLVDAADTWDWGFGTSVVVVASTDFLARERAVVNKLVASTVRADYDWRVSNRPDQPAPDAQCRGPCERVAPDGRPNGWDEGGPWVGLLTSYTQLVGAPRNDLQVLGGLRTLRFLTVADQLTMDDPRAVRGLASLLFRQKLLADDPMKDPADWYDARRDGAALALAAATEKIPLGESPDAVPLNATVPVDQVPSAGEICDDIKVVDVDGNYTFSDGSTGLNNYHSGANCVWALRSTTGCVALDVDFLASEIPNDYLAVYASGGDLLARFSGRSTPERPVERVAGCVGEGGGFGTLPTTWRFDKVALYVQWITDTFDEHGLGAIEPVGFKATAVRSPTAAPVCPAGYSGARCDRESCNGIVDVTIGGASSGTIRSHPAGASSYAPYSRCGWRVDLGGVDDNVDDRDDQNRVVVLTFVELGLETVFDQVKIYRGGPPHGRGWSQRYAALFTALGPARDGYAYQFTGTRVPEAPIVVEDDVFIAFESDGLANAPRSGPAGFEIHWSIEGRGALCPDSPCDHGTCVDGACECEPGYYGDTCAFDHCLSEEYLGTTQAGDITSGVADDYPPATRCSWAFKVPSRGVTPRGLLLRFEHFSLESPGRDGLTTDRIVVYRVDDASAPDVARGDVLASFRCGSESPMGLQVVSWHGPEGRFRSTFVPGEEVEVPFPDGDTRAVAVVFESDASNPEPRDGFRMLYHVLWNNGQTHCDDDWPCTEGLECTEDAVCAPPARSKNDSRRLRRQRNRILTIIGIVVGSLLLVALALTLCRYSSKKHKLEKQRAAAVRDQVEDAISSVDDFQAPLAAVAGDTFMNLGQLVRHEVLRDRGDIYFYDAASDVAEARRRGEVFVFISHQWLGEDGPDPRGVHFAAMREAVESVARFARVKPERLRVWVDFASVPQANPLTQRLAITSVPTFSSSVNYFVVVAPATKHVVTCLTCDRASFHARVWCRAEVMACWARNGTSHMYLSTSRGIEKLFAGGEADPLLADALDVFGGNLTCCRLGHPGAQPCDREALVRPMLGLFYEIYRDRHGSRKKAWEVLEPRLKKLYPKDFDWVYFTAEGETLVERAPLFGDLIDATRAVVDLEKRGGGRNLDSSKGGTELPLLAGYAPGTNATHHLAIQKKAKSNLAVAFGRTSSALLDSARRPRPDPEDGSNGSSRTTPTPRQLDP